ncbi:MAG: helix-turn-helix domain-containing protein [Thermodesulfobacteriota bacterium]
MSLREIAKKLGRSPSVLSREFKRNATAVLRAVLPCSHEKITIFRDTLYTYLSICNRFFYLSQIVCKSL